ncbi:MAG: hypothetical protein LHW64_01755 [Candidatus Cloacimonetes bacterium]|nr:hypothetical protein [Candidatus Cloacimonadota bacterium]MDY0228833.1 hypothetical protein [Candidatus Cloacimonadaceae bacterium]
MSKTLRYLAFLLAAILLLSSCATVPKPEKTESPEALQDKSNPNLASLYYFLSGSFMHFNGELPAADQVLNLALAQDPGSFQIRKLLLVNALQIYSYDQSPPAEQRARDLLSMARDSYSFDQEMLTLAYNAYRNLNDAEGVNWALDRLLKDHPKAQVYIWEYFRQIESGKKAPVALLEKALKAQSDIPEIEYIVASLYLEKNPKRARQILLNSQRTGAGELLLLEIYRLDQQIAKLQAHYHTYHYPEDKTKIHEYLFFLQKHSLQELALSHLDDILQTGDAELINAASYLAFLAQDLPAQTKVYQYLITKTSAPADDSSIAALLLLSYIVNPEFTQGLQMTDKIYQIKDLVYISYLFASQVSYTEEREKEYQKVFLKLHQHVQKNLPPSLIKDFLVDHTAFLAGLYDSDSGSAVVLAEWLIAKGYGGEEDFELLFEHYSDISNPAKQIEILQESLARFPRSATIKNNLGYILLNYPEHLAEAERLISEALREQPENVSFQDSWVWLLYKQGRYDAAYAYLPKVLENAQVNAELFYHAAMICQAAGARDEAIKFLQQILLLQTPGEYQDKASEELRRLEAEGK